MSCASSDLDQTLERFQIDPGKIVGVVFTRYLVPICFGRNCSSSNCEKCVLAIRRIFFLVGMITNTKFSHCPNDFKIGGVRQ